jgi:hypothetical protein
MKVEIKCPTPGAEIHYTVMVRDPNELSKTYTGPIALSDPKTVIRAVAYHPEYNDSDIAVSCPPEGGGLFSSIFSRINFTGKTFMRTDPEVNLSWGESPPHPEAPADIFSVIWTGHIEPPKSEVYTFFLTGDDGVRLWINDRCIIDGWKEQPPTEYKAEIPLTAGKKYDIKVAHCEIYKVASIKLEWSSPSIPREVVPRKCLFVDGRYTDEILFWNKTGTNPLDYVNRGRTANPGALNGSAIVKSKNTKDIRTYLRLD